MNRYDHLKQIFFQNIESHSHGIYKQKAYFHSIQVSILCYEYALKRGLNSELAMIIGLFHDYAYYLYQSSFNHGERSSELLKPYLNDFTNEEQNIILNAIKHHSDKDHIHDDYCELIKDMDLLIKAIEEPNYIFNQTQQKRLKEL